MNNVFVDLDETLIHTLSSLYDKDPDPIPGVKHESIVLEDSYTYRASLRPGALQLLEQLRGKAEVYMLTVATHDYAIAWNKMFNLGFPEDRIFSRKNVNDGYHVKPANVQDGITYLIDNLESHDNYKKIRFITHIKRPIYIKVQDYYGHPTQSFTEESIAHIIGRIV